MVLNSAGYASNMVDVLTVKYHTATINAGQPQSVTTFVGHPDFADRQPNRGHAAGDQSMVYRDHAA